MNLSVVIPTHERPNEIFKLVSDLLNKNLALKIIVIDTSKSINYKLSNINNHDCKYIYLTDNRGISYSRNLGLSEVESDLVLFMDDDFVLSYKSRLTEFKNEFLELECDVLGGRVNNINVDNYDFHGKYIIKNKTLYHYVGLNSETGKYDVIFNYFIARTQTILDIGGWDDNLKFAREHDDFFLNGKQKGLRVSYNKNFGIYHIHSGVKHYENQEKYNKGSSIKYFCQKWGICSKIEVRLIGKGKGKYLSIYRFMGGQYIDITENELKEIYREYMLEYGNTPFIYKHVGYE